MEVVVDFLALVLVIVQTELVVMGRLVLPLATWLDTKQFHEVLDLDIGVPTAERLTRPEESIFDGPRGLHISSWPRVRVCLLFVVVSIVFFTTFSFLITFLIVIAFTLTAIEFFFFILFWICVFFRNDS